MWTPPVNDSAELKQGALQLIHYAQVFHSLDLHSVTSIGVLLPEMWCEIFAREKHVAEKIK
jgi:hypothetical protein